MTVRMQRHGECRIGEFGASVQPGGRYSVEQWDRRTGRWHLLAWVDTRDQAEAYAATLEFQANARLAPRPRDDSAGLAGITEVSL